MIRDMDVPRHLSSTEGGCVDEGGMRRDMVCR